MGVLIVSGSPRKNGNTEILLSICKNELQDNHIDTQLISLAGKRIGHCVNCDQCIGTNQCFQNDDFNGVYGEVLTNRGFVVGSPVYVGLPTSLLMAFLGCVDIN